MTLVNWRLKLLARMGPGWVLWRAAYALRKRSGLLRSSLPAVSWGEVNLADLVTAETPGDPESFRAHRETCDRRFFFPLGELPDRGVLRQMLGEAGIARTLAVAEDYCRGHFLYYSRQVWDLGRPVNWLWNPIAGAEHVADRHWCDYPTFLPNRGDVKDVWEPSRFACAFWLVRAYALTGEEKYPAAFWEMFEGWCRQNPPNMGPNWKCGQEAAIRSFAWCFALHGFWRSAETSSQRVCDMVKMLAIHADRIDKNIGYAISQKNNHGLSEAIGLLTVGLLFPELRGAARWHARGRKLLEREVRRQIYADGSFVQHSMNYHRVMLHDCLWAIRLAELNDQPLSAELFRRVGLAGEFLQAMMDESTGLTPNYGANDGALVLPLSACDHRDYRPTVQAARYQATGRRVVRQGPWDEPLVWLHGAEAAASPREDSSPSSRRFDDGGYYTLHGAETWCMIRCHSYRDRPAHVDPLHVDLWYKGVNLLRDSGTYKYYAPDEPQMERYFKDIAAHNTIELGGRGPLDLVSRFLWLPWPKAMCAEHSDSRWRGEHYAYSRSPWHVVHQRTVELIGDAEWIITDDLAGSGAREIALRWHLCDGRLAADVHQRRIEIERSGARATLLIEGPDEMQMDVQQGVDKPGDVAGWTSHYYSQREPRPTVRLSGSCVLPCQIRTRIQLAAGRSGTAAQDA
jgi:hypothetical protein